MPPLILWAFGIAGAALIGKLAHREMRRINEELERVRSRQMGRDEGEPVKTLRRDPRTGVYRAD